MRIALSACITLVSTCGVCLAAPPEVPMLDLAVLQPGLVQRFELPAEEMAQIGLRGFAPSASYRMSMRTRQSVAARTHDAERLESRLDIARHYNDTCSIELVTALMATREEAEAVRLLHAPNPANCASSSRVGSIKKELSRPDSFLLGVLEPGVSYAVLIERLRLDGSVERTWRLEIQAKEPKRDRPRSRRDVVVRDAPQPAT
jgi:hypothetical protein